LSSVASGDHHIRTFPTQKADTIQSDVFDFFDAFRPERCASRIGKVEVLRTYPVPYELRQNAEASNTGVEETDLQMASPLEAHESLQFVRNF